MGWGGVCVCKRLTVHLVGDRPDVIRPSVNHEVDFAIAALSPDVSLVVSAFWIHRVSSLDESPCPGLACKMCSNNEIQ